MKLLRSLLMLIYADRMLLAILQQFKS